jgi:predicted permease
MLIFTLALSLIVVMLFSIAPIFNFLRPNLAIALRQNSATASRTSQRFRKIAVGVQIAFSVLLLGCGGLFVQTLNHLRHQPIGFDTGNMVTFRLDPGKSGYGEDRTAQIVTNSLDALRRIPGVVLAAATNDPELAHDSNTSNFTVQGHKRDDDEEMNFECPRVTPNYFATLKQPLLVGREFSSSDAKGAPLVAIVSLSFVKRFYGSAENALGRQIGDNKADATIIGVVGDIKHGSLRSDIKAAVYRPYLQQDHPGGVQINARIMQPPQSAETAIRQSIHALDPTLVVDDLRTMEEQADHSASYAHALAMIAVAFAALAMLLAAVGLYGVLAYSSEQRTREFGVRLALGAHRWSVVTLVVREMALIASAATLIALPSVVGMARLFRNQLYGVTTFDPPTLTVALLLTALMVVLAALIPARRAASIEPMQALRSE